jgi:hypothetical protein
MAETYKLELYASGPFVGCESNEVVNLSDYGYTDEDWDEIDHNERERLLEEWGSDFFWNEGYEYNAQVVKDG